MTERQVKFVLDGETGQAHPVDTEIPQGSPVAPILFVTYLSGFFDEVEREVPGIRVLSFADDIVWWAEGSEEQEEKLAEAAKAAIRWADNNGIAFDERKTEASLFKRKGRPSPASIQVGNKSVSFNLEVTHWLGCG
jgi:hypothetical protein